MRKIIVATMLSVLILSSACSKKVESGEVENGSGGMRSGVAGGEDVSQKKPEPTPAVGATGEPRTIRDFFMLLPEKYFVLEGCEREKDKDCSKAKVDYLKTFTEVEDTANGYLKGGCDGAQSCLEMTIFKRPDGTYLVAVSTEGEMIIDQHFLDYAGGKWTDVGAQIIPEFSKKNFYELPRKGTMMTVFSKKIIEKGDDYEVAEKGSRLYSLVWKDGKFSKSK